MFQLIRNRKLQVLEVFWDSGQYMAQACVYSCQQYLLYCWLRWIRWIRLPSFQVFSALVRRTSSIAPLPGGALLSRGLLTMRPERQNVNGGTAISFPQSRRRRFSGWRWPNPTGAPACRPKFGWRRRQTFPAAAAAAEFGAISWFRKCAHIGPNKLNSI